MIRAVVFDLFDTLVDIHMDELPRVVIGGQARPSTYGLVHAALRERVDVSFDLFAEAMRTVDRGWRERAYKEGREITTMERFTSLLERLGIEDEPLAERLTAVHMGALRRNVRPVPHHPEVLAGLASRWRLGVCSNFTDSPTALRVLDESGLAPHLHAVTISADVGVRKPRPEIFAATLAKLGVEPAEAVHVGDNLDADVGGAAALGVRTVWIHRRVRDPETLLARHRGPAPTATVADLRELPAVLEGLS